MQSRERILASVASIDSNESEGAFKDFVEEQIERVVDQVIREGDFENISGPGSEVIVEIDDITPPVFTYGDEQGGNGGGGGGPGQPGKEGGKLRFALPFQRFMDMVARKLNLPNLKKEGEGKIKEISYEFKTFAPAGVILDKKRTFKRALRTSVGMRQYVPAEGKRVVQVMRRDRRYKVPMRVEKPRYKAVVFYMGDISYSTYGQRLELEKSLVAFIQNWLDYNYEAKNVEHRFFVHDVEAYEVQPEDFYRVNNIGGTRASQVFELVYQIAFNEYNPAATNFYAFYFGDGELFDEDSKQIAKLIEDNLAPIFNRIGVVEVIPSSISKLRDTLARELTGVRNLRLAQLKTKTESITVIKKLFGA